MQDAKYKCVRDKTQRNASMTREDEINEDNMQLHLLSLSNCLINHTRVRMLSRTPAHLFRLSLSLSLSDAYLSTALHRRRCMRSIEHTQDARQRLTNAPA